MGFRNIQREKDDADKAAQAVVAKAKAMAIALQTIGKFIIKKKVGESDQIYGRLALCTRHSHVFQIVNQEHACSIPSQKVSGFSGCHRFSF